MTTKQQTKQHILNVVDDLVGRLVYYDRKEDEELPRGAIETAVKDGAITVDEIIAKFADALRTSLRE